MRASTLEDARRELEKCIAVDKQHGWSRAQVEKQLLLVEVIDEISRLEDEGSEDIAVVALEILEDASSACGTMEWEVDDMYARYEVAFLRIAASLLVGGDLSGTELGGKVLHAEDTRLKLHKGPSAAHDSTHYLQLFALSLQTQNPTTFKHSLRELREGVSMAASIGRSLAQAKLLTVEGMIYYLILEFDDVHVRELWKIAGIETFTQGARKVLDCFSKSIYLKEEMLRTENMENGRSSSRFDNLPSSQMRTTNDLDQLCFDICLELAFGLQDIELTWKRIQ